MELDGKQHDYCPVSQAIDLLADRWTLGIVFHALIGRRRFADFADAMPRISRATLSKRLKLLVRAEVLERVEQDDGRVEYRPTGSGEELWPIVNELGVWGERWIREIVTDDAVDPARVMWDIRRKLSVDRMPVDRVVVHFHFVDVAPDRTHYWLVLDRAAPDLCQVDPGFGDDVLVRTRPGPIGAYWSGDANLDDFIDRGIVIVQGLPRLCRELPRWLGRSRFAEVSRPAERPRPGSDHHRPLEAEA